MSCTDDGNVFVWQMQDTGDDIASTPANAPLPAVPSTTAPRKKGTLLLYLYFPLKYASRIYRSVLTNTTLFVVRSAGQETCWGCSARCTTSQKAIGFGDSVSVAAVSWPGVKCLFLD